MKHVLQFLSCSVFLLLGCSKDAPVKSVVSEEQVVDENYEANAPTETCLPNTVNVNSLVGSCNAIPANLPELTLGLNYTSVTDLAQGVYETYLYPDSNTAPASHRAKGDSIANVLRAGGAIKVVCYGMSSSKLIFDNLLSRLPGSSLDNPNVTIVDKAESGCDLGCWISKGSLPFDAAVKVVFLYHSNNKPQSSSCTTAKRFPTHANNTKANLETFLGYVKTAHPNAKMVFISSREFGGWSCPPSGTKYLEPVAYEEGFSVKWFVEAHLGQTTPWIGWGPYTWSRATPRNHFRQDGAHPCTTTGAPAFGQQWFDWLLADPTAKIWFAANP